MTAEPLPKKKISPWVWVGCGCASLVGVALAFTGFVFFVIIAALRASEPYQDGVAAAQADPRVREALGAPIEPGWLISGSIQTENRSGDCDITVPLNGTRRSGELRVIGTKDAGVWTYTRMTVTPDGGTAIDILER